MTHAALVLHDVDEALRSLIATTAVGGAKPVCSFETPTAEWSAGLKGRAVNLFLLDIRENADVWPGDWADVRDESGRLVGRQPPLRRYDMRYVVSAWGGSVEDQRDALDALLVAVPAYDTLPPEMLTGSLRDQDIAVRLRIAEDELGVGLTDLWSSLGQPPRATVVLVVTAPVIPELVTELAPPASSIDIGLAGSRPRAGHPPVPDLADIEPVSARAPGSGEDEGQEETAAARGWTRYRVRERLSD